MLRMMLLAFFAVGLSGCVLGPVFERPEIDLGTGYREAVPAGESVANLPWWELFKDPQIQELVRTALQTNRNLEAAAERIAQARAMVGYTAADQYPSIDLSADGSRNRSGGNSNDTLSGGGSSISNNFSVAGNLSFEVDIWGKLRRATEAQRAQLLSSEYAYRAIVLSLVSEVARTYFHLLSLDRQLEISRSTLENRRGATKVIRDRFLGGTVAQIDVNQAEIEEGDAAVAAASQERLVRQTENALNILLGRAPQPIIRGAALTADFFPAGMPTGFPAELLSRRPDLLEAEENARAQAALVGVAEAQRLPALSLTGVIGLNSQDFDDLFDAQAKTWSIGGGLLSPLVDFGKNRYRVESQQALFREAVASYEQTALIAVQEVEDALVAVRTYRMEYEARTAQLVAAKNASMLSRRRYDDGVTSYLEVLDIERSLFTSELATASTLQNYLSSIVQVYAALGGGWSR